MRVNLLEKEKIINLLSFHIRVLKERKALVISMKIIFNNLMASSNLEIYTPYICLYFLFEN